MSGKDRLTGSRRVCKLIPIIRHRANWCFLFVERAVVTKQLTTSATDEHVKLTWRHRKLRIAMYGFARECQRQSKKRKHGAITLCQMNFSGYVWYMTTGWPKKYRPLSVVIIKSY